MPQYLIIAKDFTDPQALERRMRVRNDHLQRMKIEKAADKFITGGATLNAAGNMNGSMLLVEMQNESDVQKWIESDPYVLGKVWEKVEITPFKIAKVD